MDRVLKHLRQCCLDIRQTNNGRWYDQKITPDIMSAICDVIVRWHEDHGPKASFSRADLQETDAFRDFMVSHFGKPDPQDPSAQREYDKVIGQPINVLHAAGLIEQVSTSPRGYKVLGKLLFVLRRMASNEQEAVQFLYVYVNETCLQSGLSSHFSAFFENQDTNALGELRGYYVKFIQKHTGITRDLEPRRVFPKVLNIQAYSKKKQGIVMGRLSAAPISLYDIRYNRINFRDIKKLKGIPRRRARQIQESTGESSRHVMRVVKDVKDYHENIPEIKDAFSITDSTSSRSVEGHHIFPKSVYPQLADVRENIILLTPTQHQSQAHGYLDVDPAYQLLCLIKKLEGIKACEENPNSTFYSFRVFVRILYAVGILDVSEDKAKSMKYDDALREIVRAYSPKSLKKVVRKL